MYKFNWFILVAKYVVIYSNQLSIYYMYYANAVKLFELIQGI